MMGCKMAWTKALLGFLSRVWTSRSSKLSLNGITTHTFHFIEVFTEMFTFGVNTKNTEKEKKLYGGGFPKDYENILKG